MRLSLSLEPAEIVINFDTRDNEKRFILRRVIESKTLLCLILNTLWFRGDLNVVRDNEKFDIVVWRTT